MGCSSCGTGKDGQPAGCRNNGTCGTGGCNKLNVYNWLTDMALPHGQQPFGIVEVRFKGSRKEFFHNKENISLRVGDVVAVESSPGHDIGVVSMTGELVRFQLKKKNLSETSDSIRALYRKAKQNEVEKWYEVKDKENQTLHRTREIIQALKLSMKLSDVEFQGDGKKATFYYTAEDRVDFRELIKRLAEEFRIRVEMRQIGMRQEASRLGGIGVCGRELCCSTWLTDFKTVSTSTARYQNLALNPAKLAGQCSKLKCCLNYELDSYLDALRDFPSTNIVLETEKGKAYHRKTDIFKRLMWYALNTDDRRENNEMMDGGVGGNWIMLPVDRVKEIIELNKQQIRPAELALPSEAVFDDEPDYTNVVGQDRIDRMDKLKKKKKKKKKPQGERKPEAAGAQQPETRQQQPPRQQGGQRPQQQQSRGDRQQQNQPRQGGNQPRPQGQGQGNQQRRPQNPNQGQQQRPQQQRPGNQQRNPNQNQGRKNEGGRKDQPGSQGNNPGNPQK